MKNQKFFRKKIPKNFFDVEKSKVANRPKRVFPKFRADRSQVRGANGRSKFEFLWSNTFEYVRIRSNTFAAETDQFFFVVFGAVRNLRRTIQPYVGIRRNLVEIRRFLVVQT